MVPMLDLKKQMEGLRDEMLREVAAVIESGQYVLGKKVLQFEQKAAEYIGARHAIGVASGTDALHLSLKALGIGPGDEVITTPFTFFSTVEAIMYLNATPVLADIETETFNIDPAKIEEKITPRTKALIPVHIFGCPARMDEILRIAGKYNLKVVEDCAQSFGAALGGKKTGSIGDAGCFSFYPSKNLGAYGDGGLVCVNDDSVAAEIRLLRNHGSSGGYMHSTVGFNSRLDEIQAAILLVKMGKIDSYNEKRRQKAALYNKKLLCGAGSSGIMCPPLGEGGSSSFTHVFHQYTIRHPRRDAVREKLRSEQVSSMIYYPVPMHLQPALKFMGHKEGDFPAAEAACREVVSLPIYPELEDQVIERICNAIKSV